MATNYTWPPVSATFTPSGTQDVNITQVGGNAVTTTVPVSGTVSTTTAANTNGSVVNGALTATTASSESAPATAVGFILEAPSNNTDNIRYRIGGTASTSAGMLMEPGRDTGVIPIKATISICATVSGTNAYSILWVLTS